MLTDAETFAFGALGAVVGLMVVQVLPWALALAGGADFHFTFLRIFGAIVVLTIFVLGGGLVAVLLGDADQAKQAIAYGLGWQSTIGGFLQGSRAVERAA